MGGATSCIELEGGSEGSKRQTGRDEQNCFVSIGRTIRRTWWLSRIHKAG